MKNFFRLLIGCLFIVSSCNKSSTPGVPPSNNPTGNPNNEVKATVSVKGNAASPFTATRDQTLFSKFIYSNGDTSITILGSIGLGSNSNSITIRLFNINSTGNYVFENNSNSRSYPVCEYSIGNILIGPVFEGFIATTGNQPGTITIDSLTPNSIKGSFTAKCVGTTGIIQITNGSFKGEF